MESPKAFFSSTTGSRPFCLQFRSSDWFIISSVSIAIFSEVFLYAVVVPVLPFALNGRVGISQDDVQKWTAVLLSVYAAFLLAFSPIAGWAADKTTTRRGPLLLSLVTFAAATLLLMFGRSIGALVAGRALQGASAAAVWSIGLALLVDTVGVERIGESMGYVSYSMSLGIFCGPLLGGVVYEKGGYFAVFYMCLGVVAFDIVLRLLIVEKHIARRWLKEEADVPVADMDEEGFEQTTAAPAAVPNVMADADRGPSEKTAAESANICAKQRQHPSVAHAPSCEHQPSNAHPSRPKARRLPAAYTLLSSRRLLVALWATLVVSTINTSFDTIIPIRVADLFDWDSVGAGLVFLAVVLPGAIGPLVGKLADRVGARLIATVGFALLCPVLVCLRFVDHNSINQKVLLCALLACAGGAVSMLLVPVLTEITHCVESMQRKHPEKFGSRGAFAQGYGIMNAFYAVGTLIGPIWSGFSVQNAGWGTTTWSLGLLAGVTVLPMFFCLGGWIGRRGWKEELFRPERALARKAEDSDGDGRV